MLCVTAMVTAAGTVGLFAWAWPRRAELLAGALFRAGQASRVIAVELPASRAMMHLDTVMTMLDRDTFSALAASLNWFVWAGLISLLVGFHHSPPLDDLSPISPGRRVVGIACLVLMVLLVVGRNVRALAVPVRDEADLLGLVMLQHLVSPARWTVDLTSPHLLAAEVVDLESVREILSDIVADDKRAAAVISGLRALIKKGEPELVPLDLNAMLGEVAWLLRSDTILRHVSMSLELAPDLPRVRGDRVQLQQVVLNLLLNASDAMIEVDDRPRKIVIRTERDGGETVRLTVQDAGVGVEPQAVDKLFEAFYTTKSGGMGIGLSVSRSIIERHHGRLWAAPNDGPGATFSFSIPPGSEDVMVAYGPGAIRTSAATDAQHGVRSL